MSNAARNSNYKVQRRKLSRPAAVWTIALVLPVVVTATGPRQLLGARDRRMRKLLGLHQLQQSLFEYPAEEENVVKIDSGTFLLAENDGNATTDAGPNSPPSPPSPPSVDLEPTPPSAALTPVNGGSPFISPVQGFIPANPSTRSSTPAALVDSIPSVSPPDHHSQSSILKPDPSHPPVVSPNATLPFLDPPRLPQPEPRLPVVLPKKIEDLHPLPQRPPKIINYLAGGKAGGKAGLLKSSKKSKKGCHGVLRTRPPSTIDSHPPLASPTPGMPPPPPPHLHYYCAPSASPRPSVTPYPTSTPPPSTEENQAQAEECQAIRRGQGPISDPSQSYTLNFILILNEGVNVALQNLEDFMQQVVASNLVGCLSRASADTGITNAVFDVYEDSDLPACATDIPGTSCHHVDVDARIYFQHEEQGSNFTSSDFYKYLLRFCEDFKDVPGIERTFDPCSAMDVTGGNNSTGGGGGSSGGDGGGSDSDSDGGGSAIIGTRDAPAQGVSIGGLIGVVLAALFLILVILFAARRKQKGSQAMKHQKLEEFDDSTYLKDDFDNSTLYSPRRAHVLSEEDSIVTGFTPYRHKNPKVTPAGEATSSVLFNRKDHHDVHVCSSATCEACEQRRQSGLQFIPAVMPSHSYDSVSHSRSYVASNTVQL